MKNYYEILGVNKYATTGQIRSAYVNKIKFLHPDKVQDSNVNNLNELKAINEAYGILKDPIKREEYNNSAEKERNTIFYEKANYYYPEQNIYDLEYFKKYRRVIILIWVVLGFLVSLVVASVFSLNNLSGKSDTNNSKSNIQNQAVPNNNGIKPSIPNNNGYQIKPNEI